MSQIRHDKKIKKVLDNYYTIRYNISVKDRRKQIMKKTFTYNGIYLNGRRKLRVVAMVEVTLTEDNNFSASGCVKWFGKSILGGQCLEEIKNIAKCEKMDIIYDMWKKHHLNDMHGGTKKQEQALIDKGLTQFANKYNECCDYLKSIGLFEDNGCKFGHAWYKWDIPAEDLEVIKDLLM